MSAESNDGYMERKPGVRVFADEFNDSPHNYKLSEDDRAPKYTLLPTGEQVNRVFIVGSITNIEERESENGVFVMARINDTVDTFYMSASPQYQSQAAAALRDMEAPTYAAIVGKVAQYDTQDGETRVEIRPESVSEVSESDRNQWVAETARATRDRVERYLDAVEGDGEMPQAVEMAEEEYDADLGGYLDTAETALANVFNE